MFRLIAAALAALFAVLYVFGDESRRLEIARAPTGTTLQTLTLGNVLEKAGSVETAPVSASAISESEAIRLALEAGSRARAAGVSTLGVMVSDRTSDPQVENGPVPETEIRYVTAERVNLRAGPGTGNAVVGQISLGAEAVVLDDKNGWFRIRTADGGPSGWIFGEFLAGQRPG